VKKALKTAMFLCFTVLFAAPSAAQAPGNDGTEGARWGGPNAVENQLRDDAAVDRPTLFERWFEWKDGLTEKHGFSFGVDYSDGPVLRFLGPGGPRDKKYWSLRVESGAPAQLHRRGAQRLRFQPRIHRAHRTAVLGPGYPSHQPLLAAATRRGTRHPPRRLLDATDYVDVYALASPWTGFLNFAFSTGTTTLAVPNDAAFGAAAGAMLTDNLFLIGSVSDLNADPTDPGETVDSFFSDHEYFKSVEIGWTTAQDRIYLDNVHLTLWHADEREQAAQPSGWGANLSWTAYLAGKWLPFVRAGFADDGGSLTQKSVSVGFGYQKNPGKNLLGVGLNWGQPNEDTWGSGLRDQYTAELFYRWQISKAIAVTPDLQYIRNPAFDPDANSIWVFGLRVRGAL
jgi:porin